MCCIDKTNSTELGEAINAMYKWYHKSEVCYAYLHDVGDPSMFTEGDWFTRGWTLQELIAPKELKFFTKDWVLIGTRKELIDRIAERTGISREILRTSKIPAEVTISQKMVWAARREMTKVEDRAYSLLGILGVNMVPVYGVDEGAFDELQHKIIARYADQTLFAWYHVPTLHEDIMTINADRATEPTAPAPESATEPASGPVECDGNNPSPNSTGLLASSPSQFLKSYEISEEDFRKNYVDNIRNSPYRSEEDFRKNYVDNIRDSPYRSHFSISNNFVQICAPVKHVEGKIWKAVLRCSLEHPDGDQIQRPLVIYLEEIQPWKYFRAHLARDDDASGIEGVGDDRSNEVKDVPGSLERLSDAEAQLQGYVLQDIAVVGRFGEAPPNEAQQRSPADDQDAPPTLTEEQRIAQLPRHPPGVKTTNILVCGEPGVAAGRVINLIVGETIIKPLTDYEREAMAVTPIDATLQSKNVRILYVIGPRDPYLDLDVYHVAVRHMYQLVQRVKDAGGIHLVLLCMVGSKVTPAVEANYRLFHDFVCQGRVPTMLVVTGLGKARRMEDWWDKHKNDRELQAMEFVDHACITVLQGEDEEHQRKYELSTKRVQKLITDFTDRLETAPKVFCPEDVGAWFVLMGRRAMDLLLRGQKGSVNQETIAKTLKEAKTLKDVHLTEAEATNLAGQFFDEHAMEL